MSNIALRTAKLAAYGSYVIRNPSFPSTFSSHRLISTSCVRDRRSTWNHCKFKTGRKYKVYSPLEYHRDVYRRPTKSLYYRPEEWAAEPEYPEIVPPPKSRAGIRHSTLGAAAEVEKIPTVLDKMRYFWHQPLEEDTKWREHHMTKSQKFWRPWRVSGFSDLYNILPLYQYLSRTSVVSEELPKDYYGQLDDTQLNALVEKVRLPVIDALLTQRKYLKKNFDIIPLEEQELVYSAKNVVDAMLRVIDVSCADEFPHLRELQVDTDTRIEAFWKRSGFQKFEGELKREEPFWRRPQLETPHEFPLVDKHFPTKATRDFLAGVDMFQYMEDGHMHKLCRHEHPLPQVIPREASQGVAAPVVLDQHPCEKPPNEGDMQVCSPDTYGFDVVHEMVSMPYDRIRPQQIPGFWFGDPCEFSTLSLNVPLKWQEVVRDLGEDAAVENMKANLVLGSFSRIMGQAVYLGFSPLNELTYPITTQSIITNGRDWMFCLYQGNTIALWQEDGDNPYQNLAWVTNPIRLFERLDEDSVVGFNDEVVKNLLKMYLKPPVPRAEINLRPFLKYPLKTYWKREDSQVPFWTKQDNVSPRFNIYQKRVEV